MVVHGRTSHPLGTRKTFADVAATLAAHFRLRNPWPIGKSFLTRR
jgi:phosphopentomutase